MSALLEYAEAIKAAQLPLTDKDKYEKWLTEITYKPGTVFRLLNMFDGLVLHVTVPIVDVNNPEVKDVLAISSRFTNCKSKREFVDMVWMLLTELEQHEQKEWFRIKGQFYKDPHPYEGFNEQGVRVSNVWKEEMQE